MFGGLELRADLLTTRVNMDGCLTGGAQCSWLVKRAKIHTESFPVGEWVSDPETI